MTKTFYFDFADGLVYNVLPIYFLNIKFILNSLYPQISLIKL